MSHVAARRQEGAGRRFIPPARGPWLLRLVARAQQAGPTQRAASRCALRAAPRRAGEPGGLAAGQHAAEHGGAAAHHGAGGGGQLPHGQVRGGGGAGGARGGARGGPQPAGRRGAPGGKGSGACWVAKQSVVETERREGSAPGGFARMAGERPSRRCGGPLADVASGGCACRLYDEVPPANVLNMRTAPTAEAGPGSKKEAAQVGRRAAWRAEHVPVRLSGGWRSGNAPPGTWLTPCAPTAAPSPVWPQREFLVSFADGRDDEWLPERCLAPDSEAAWVQGRARTGGAAPAPERPACNSRAHAVKLAAHNIRARRTLGSRAAPPPVLRSHRGLPGGAGVRRGGRGAGRGAGGGRCEGGHANGPGSLLTAVGGTAGIWMRRWPGSFRE